MLLRNNLHRLPMEVGFQVSNRDVLKLRLRITKVHGRFTRSATRLLRANRLDTKQQDANHQNDRRARMVCQLVGRYWFAERDPHTTPANIWVIETARSTHHAVVIDVTVQ